MPAPPLPGVFADLAPLLDHWGYAAVGGLLLLEDFGVPVPGETVLIAAAVYASRICGGCRWARAGARCRRERPGRGCGGRG
ncbi:hypothetical protein AB0M32_18800 [Streptomyces sp. NPDC051985]|uniref:hypothetical protein n=1 Tax=Streptomyces sp. NPDC051985 TaxID=3155807 RepID=UPI00342AC7EA